ncbi:hypothetical protein ACS0TY_007571 [Phlomoides rotata]
MYIGMVLRDNFGEFIIGRSRVFEGCVGADIREALGFFEALSWLKEVRYDEVMVEGDAKIVVDAINSPVKQNSTFGDCIDVCRTILLDSPRSAVIFAKRSANVIAHELAKISRFFLEILIIGLICRILWLDS